MIAAAGVAAVHADRDPAASRPAALLVAGLLLGMAPAAIRNVVVAHQWSLVSSHGGLNFYIGNSERATGFYMPVPGITPTIAGQEKDARRVAERALGQPVDRRRSVALLLRSVAGLDGVASGRRRWRSSRGSSTTCSTRRTSRCPTRYPVLRLRRRTALRFYVVGPWLLIPLGLVGLAARPRPRPRRVGRRTLVWASFVPAYAAAVALFFVAERYRLPLLVPLCAGAGAAIDRAIACRRRRAAGPALARWRRRPLCWPSSPTGR